jgi:hypothetical protein
MTWNSWMLLVSFEARRERSFISFEARRQRSSGKTAGELWGPRLTTRDSRYAYNPRSQEDHREST